MHDEIIKIAGLGTNFLLSSSADNQCLAGLQQFLRSQPPPPGNSGVLLLTTFQVQELSTEGESCKTNCSSEP